MKLINRGGSGTIYQVNDFIAVKRLRTCDGAKEDHVNEQKMFELLEKHPPVPYLIRSYHRTPSDTFLELACDDSIAMLLNRGQQRLGEQVLSVSQLLDSEDIHRWMKQLCSAVAALEQIEITHGDIRPGNLLLDKNRNLKLCDLGRALRFGEAVEALDEPFGRLLGPEGGEDEGSYGSAGARTETFAIGSLYYTLLRGHEPYETQAWGNDHHVILLDKFQAKEFPQLNNSPEDAIIHKCWNNEYTTVKNLLAEFTNSSVEDELHVEEDPEWLDLRRAECEEIVRNGTLDKLERY